MKDLFLRRLNEEKSALEGVNKALERGEKFYAKRQDQYKKAMASGDTRGAALAQGKINAIQVGQAGKLSQKQDIEETLKEMQSNPNIRNRIAAIAGAIAASAEVVKAGADLYQRGKTITEANIGASYTPTSSIFRGLAGGDLTSLAAISSPEAAAKFMQASGTGAPTLSMLGGILGKIGTGVGGGAMFGGVPGALIGGGLGALSAGGDIMNLFTGGAEAAQGRKMQEQIQNLRQENFVTDTLMQDVQSNAAFRESAGLRLGGRGGMIRSIGGGLGLGTTEQITGQAMALEQAVGLPNAKPMFDAMFRMQKGRSGVNVSNESAVNLLGGLSMGTGGAAGAGPAAEAMLTRVFANGFKNARVGEEIATVMGSTMQQSERLSANNPLNMALSNLNAENKFMTGKDLDIMDARHIKGGYGVIEDTFHRSGPFEAMRLATARDIISKTQFGSGPMAEYMVSALSQMSTRDVLGGATAPLTDLMGGATKGNTKMASNILSQFKNQEMSRTLQMLFHKDPNGLISKITKGGDITAGMASLTPDELNQTKRLLQTRINNAGATDADYRMGVELLGNLTGVHTGIPTGKSKKGQGTNLGGGMDSSYLAQKTATDFEAMSAEAKDPKVQAAIKNMAVNFQSTIDIFKAGAEPVAKFNEQLSIMMDLINGKLTPAQARTKIAEWTKEQAKKASEEQAQAKKDFDQLDKHMMHAP